MGNRAVIGFEDMDGNRDTNSVGIYLHWNGGRDSVESFLKAAKGYGVRGGDSAYCIARLTQIIANFLGGTLSIGISNVGDWDLDFLDNGVYWVDGLEIYDRTDTWEGHQEQNSYDHEELVKQIIDANSFVHEETNEVA